MTTTQIRANMIAFAVAQQTALHNLKDWRTGLRFHRKSGGLRTRRAILKDVAKIVVADETTRAWFQSRVEDGRLDYHAAGDLLGEPLWRIKDANEIDNYDGDLEDLSRDSFLRQEIERLLAK